METKLDKFRRLFPPRANKVLEAIRVLKNLQGLNYESDPKLIQQFNEDVREALGLQPEKVEGRLDHSYALWALECLQRREYDDALHHLKTALKSPYNE